MSLTNILELAKTHGIKLIAEGETLRYQARATPPRDVLLAIKQHKQELLLYLSAIEHDLRRLERLLSSGEYEGKSYELVKHYLERYRRGDMEALAPLLAYCESEEVQNLLWTVN